VKHKPLLAWWAIFPVILYVIALTIYSPRHVSEGEGGSGYAIGLVTGGAIAGVLISLIISWIVYRLASRSQSTGTIAFSALILFFCVSVILNSRPKTGRRYAAPTFGIAFDAPAKWQVVPKDALNRVAIFSSPDSTPENTRQMLAVLCEKGESGNTIEVAMQLAKNWGGKITEHGLGLDGADALRVERDPTPSFRFTEAIVAEHNGHRFYIMGGAARGGSCHDEVELVRRTWKWTDVESPARYLEFHKEPISELGGKIKINYPLVACTLQTKVPETNISIAIPNINEDLPDVEVAVKLDEFPPGGNFESIKEAIAKNGQQEFKTREPFRWTDLPGTPRRSITQSADYPLGGRPGATLTWAIVDLDGKRFALINFTIFARNPQDRPAYEAAARKIVESVSAGAP